MKSILIPMILVGLATTTGCAVLQDYQRGASTPLASGEVSVRDSAKPIADVVGAVFPPAAGPALAILTAFGTWKRGRRLRKGLPASSNPITGHWGSKFGLESVVQQLSNIVSGVFEVGPEGSGIRRGWKVLLASGFASVLLPVVLQIPAVQSLAINHADLAFGLFGIITAFIASLEKEISKVLPTKPE